MDQRTLVFKILILDISYSKFVWPITVFIITIWRFCLSSTCVQNVHQSWLGLDSYSGHYNGLMSIFPFKLTKKATCRLFSWCFKSHSASWIRTDMKQNIHCDSQDGLICEGVNKCILLKSFSVVEAMWSRNQILQWTRMNGNSIRTPALRSPSHTHGD